MRWTKVEGDETLDRAEADDTVYHVCVANGLVSWWSEFGEPPTYVGTRDEAIAAVEAAHAVLSATLPYAHLPIVIWPFYEAPEALQDLSDNGGDEDWLALVSSKVITQNYDGLPFFLEGSPFGVCGVQEVSLLNGSRIAIACHG